MTKRVAKRILDLAAIDVPVTLDGARIEIGTVRNVLGEPVEATDEEIRAAVVEAWRREVTCG